MSSVSSGRVYFEVIDYIKRLVGEGKVRFGEKLPSEREMMETLGLSRNSIREAMRTLEHMGMTESRQGKGNFLVNHMGKSFTGVFSMLLFTGESSYLEISQLRRCLETEAVLLLAGRISPEQTEEMEQIVERMKSAPGAECAELDMQFHEKLMENSGNLLFSVLGEAMQELYAAEISHVQGALDRRQTDRLNSLHGKILQSIKDQNIQDGICAIREHYGMIDSVLGQKAENIQ